MKKQQLRESVKARKEKRNCVIVVIVTIFLSFLLVFSLFQWQERAKRQFSNMFITIMQGLLSGGELPGQEKKVTGEAEKTEAEVEPEPEQPEFRLKKVVKKKVLAKHSIDNPSSYGNRNTNMSVAADIINKATGGENGYLLQPGERFSWLEVVGETTPEKGFLLAGVIVNKQSAQDYGGGVCQVSSTIYSAAYHAGVIAKGKFYAQKHSVPSHYINPEEGDMEATVSYDSGVDFWFENPLKWPVRIKVKVKEDKVTVKIVKIVKKTVKVPIE